MFFVEIKKSKSTKLGEAVQLRLQLTQHSRDEQLMKSLVDYLGCGAVYKYREAFNFKVAKF